MEKKKLNKLSLNKESICNLSENDQMNVYGGADAEGTTSFNQNCTHFPICCDPAKTGSIPKTCCIQCASAYGTCQDTCISNIPHQCNFSDGPAPKMGPGGQCTGACGAA